MIIVIFNPLKKTRKTTTSIIISKIMSKNSKVVLSDLDPFSPYDNLYNFDSFINFNNEKILKKNIKNISNNFDLLRFDVFDEKSCEELKNYFSSIVSQLKLKGYERIIFDCSSSFGVVSKVVLNFADFVIIPFLIDEKKNNEIIKIIYSSKLVSDTKKIFFIPFANGDDKEINVKNFINFQKTLINVSTNYVVNFYPNSKLKDLIKNDKLISEYKYILRCIYKLFDN